MSPSARYQITYNAPNLGLSSEDAALMLQQIEKITAVMRYEDWRGVKEVYYSLPAVQQLADS